MAKQDNRKYIPDLIPANAMMEVVKFKRDTGEYVGMKLMEHSKFKNMEKQKGFRYQEFQNGYSQYVIKK